jgi:hypothetical protein
MYGNDPVKYSAIRSSNLFQFWNIEIQFNILIVIWQI